MKGLVVVLAVVVGLLAVLPPATAGELDPVVARLLKDADPTETVSVVVFMADAVDVLAMNDQLNRSRATRESRHYQVVTALQAKAVATQGPVLSMIERAYLAGGVEYFEPFWIANCIRVDATPAVIHELAARDDVGVVYYNYPIELIEAEDADPVALDGMLLDPNRRTAGPRSPEPGVNAVRAPEVWAYGYDGTGVLVSTLDTGVEGSHPALASRWRGVADPRYAGHPEWAFFDPVTSWTFPQDSGSHGTHTMGSVCGGAPGDQVGVAPGAQWIHAAVIDRASLTQTCTDAVLAYQWLIDPDGNPSTVWDVPDVCSNSWGIATSHSIPPWSSPCDSSFWSYLDACEAAGTVILFSAGNEGSAANTLRRPADRATDDYRTCSVGGIDANSPPNWTVYNSSSRGPTYCSPDGSAAIKPEVTAPAVSVRSSTPGSNYGTKTGTSMASPHVNGVVALMRQACPDLTPDEIKQILYDTAEDLGPVGKDNDFGYGLVDAYDAVLMAETMCGPSPPRAQDGYYETAVDTAVVVDFVATDYDGLPDPPGAMTFKVISLPAAGNTVADAYNGHVIQAGELPYELLAGGNQVVYTPTGGFWGEDTFQFVADDGGVPPEGGESDPATTTVLVMFDPPVIATTSLPDGYLNVAYGPFALQADDGQPALEWTIANEGLYYEGNLGASYFSAVGTAQGWQDDDGSWSYALPFSFPYYDQTYTSVWVCSNGFLDFASNSDDWSNTEGELISNVRIAALWDDLRTDQGGDIYIDDTVAGQVTFRWDAVTYTGQYPCNISCTLFDTGRIEFHYGSGNTNLTPTIGISSGNGTDYLLSQYNNATSLTNANSLEVYPPSPLPAGMELTPAGMLQGTPTEDGVYTPLVRVTDSLGRFDEVEFTLTISPDVPMYVVSSDPVHGAIDARRPMDPDTMAAQGWTGVALTFSAAAGSLTPADFDLSEVCVAGACDGVAPTVDSVVGAGVVATLTFDRPIDPEAWTVVTHTASGSQVALGFLPADADGSGTSNTFDVLAVIDLINDALGGGSPAMHQADIDRSETIALNDLLVLIDLLNGSPPFASYLQAELPAVP